MCVYLFTACSPVLSEPPCREVVMTTAESSNRNHKSSRNNNKHDNSNSYNNTINSKCPDHSCIPHNNRGFNDNYKMSIVMMIVTATTATSIAMKYAARRTTKTIRMTRMMRTSRIVTRRQRRKEKRGRRRRGRGRGRGTGRTRRRRRRRSR